MRDIGEFLARLWSDEGGVSSVEYALLLAFVVGGIILAAEDLSNAVGNELLDAASCVEGDSSCQ